MPPGFTESVAFSGPDGADRRALRARTAACSWPRRAGSSRSSTASPTPTPTVWADLRTKVHDFWDRGLLGLALDPNFTDRRPYVYVLYTYDSADRRHRAARGPTAARRRRAPPTTAAWSAAACSADRRQTGVETGADRGLVPAVPEPLDRHLAFGPDGALYVERRRRRELQLRRLRPGRQRRSTRAATRRAASAATLTPPTAEGGALRAQDLRTSGDPTGLDGSILRVDPATRARRCRTTRSSRSPDANARRIVAYGLRNPFRFTVRARARTRSGSATSAGTPGRRSTGSPTRPAPVDELRLALLRGQRPPGRLRRAPT